MPEPTISNLLAFGLGVFAVVWCVRLLLDMRKDP